MPRRARSLRIRLAALCLEVGGIAAIVVAIASVSLIAAAVVAGALAIVAAQFVEYVL